MIEHAFDRLPGYERAGPRLLCFYGEDAPLPDPALAAARAALNARYGPELGEPFRTAGLCLYRDGRDSVAWHGDTIGRGARVDTMVAILSLGTPRALLLRPREGGSCSSAPAEFAEATGLAVPPLARVSGRAGPGPGSPGISANPAAQLRQVRSRHRVLGVISQSRFS
jgi:hypothetical protein